MKDNQKTKKQLIDELDMLRQKMAAFEIAGSLRDASKAQQEDNAAKPKRKESRSFQEEKLNLVIEEAGLTSWDWDIEHDRKVFNPIWARMLGYTPEEFTSAIQNFSIAYFQHPEDIPVAQQAMKDCLTGKTSIYRAEYRMRTKTGDWKWMLALGKIIERNAKGKPTHITGVNLDITERKRAEEALRESEERYRSLFDRMLDGIYRSTHEGKFIDVNPAMVRMFGYSSKEEMLEVDIKNELYFAPEDRSSRVLDTGQEEIEIYRMRRKDGSEIWVEEHGHYVHDEQGRVIYHEGMMRDITERKRAEEALLLDSQMMANMVDGVYLTRASDWVIVHANNQFEEMFGYDRGELIGKHVSVVNAPSDKTPEETAKEIIEALNRNRVWEGEIHNIKKDGTTFWCRASVTTIEHSSYGTVWISVHHDITERKRAEEALGQSEERFRTLVENIPGAVYRGEPTPPWRNIYFSNEIEVITGYPVKGFLENPILINDITLPEDLEMVNKVLETSIAGRQPFTIEYRIRHADGSIRWVYEKGRAIYSEQGQPLWSDGVYMDITERKRTDEALREAQKLANIVTLAAGMAHEINSPLQVITGLTERITAQLESNQLDQSKLPRDIANINRLGWRIAYIIRSLLTYVSEMRGQVAPHDFNEIIKDTLLLTEPQLKTWQNVNVLTDLGENLPPLSCERNQIVQALINLLTNAHDAMPNGGEISIHTRYDADGKRFALQVSDTGSGIPKAIQKKIFDPFFTTKEVGQGTGLGLSIVFGVVKAHGGEIEVESAPKQGTTFTIYLPKEPIQKPVSEPRAKNQGRY